MVNQNKYIFDQNKECLPNMRVHVFKVFGHVRKDYFSKIKNTSQLRVFMYLRYSEHGQPK